MFSVIFKDLTHLVPPELLVREFYSNFFDVDEASLSFSVFICGQRLRVSPDVIASLFGVVRVPEPVYPYVESSREPPSFEAMSLLLFGHPYPYVGGTLYTSDFSAENHVVSHIALTNLYDVAHLSSISLTRVCFLYALLIGDTIDICSVICSHMIEVFQSTSSKVGLSYACLIQRLYRAYSIAFPPDGPFPDTLSAISATILSLSRAHLKRRQATTSASVPPDDPSSSVPPSILFSSAACRPYHSICQPYPDCHASSASTQASHSYLARHARATELNTRAVSRLHRLIRPLVGADALLSDISSSSESSASTGASAPSFEVPAADSFPVADPPLPSSTPAADSPPVANPTPPSSTPVADPPASSAPMSPTGTVVLSSHSSPATVVLSSPSSSAAVDFATFDASTPPLDD
ncbi:hypothetical protein CJ030_MR3G005802 [Morella rubra]|uniref:Putative plant transposon protein domain-containing protein n=1 Tax=Morella rubra TaxID=262757 RepID=A0A6A1W4F4_9ROSI|nr:hypothetical protein CJ030_MR3G005802 [Morella rubra]